MLTLGDLVLGSVEFYRILPLPDPMSLGNKPPLLSKPGPLGSQTPIDYVSADGWVYFQHFAWFAGTEGPLGTGSVAWAGNLNCWYPSPSYTVC